MCVYIYTHSYKLTYIRTYIHTQAEHDVIAVDHQINDQTKGSTSVKE